jgi:UDP-N-acetylglucosamine diphosphorylase/glucosamine-1-phosphate N-acetyltransferase
MTKTKAVILAAGEGNRMRPLTYTRPKVMLPIANRPILEHLICEMIKSGIKEFILIVGYHDEQIRNYFLNGSKWGINIQYCNQRIQLGTADALKIAQHLVRGNFLLANGDNIIDSRDILTLMSKNQNSMCTIEVEDVCGLGVVECDNGQITRIHEKSANPPSHLANAGLYFFTPDIFKAIELTPKSSRGEYEITDSIQIFIDSGKQVAYHNVSRWFDLNYPWDLLNANETMLANLKSQNLGEIESNVTLKNEVSIGKGTIIRSGAYIVGPVAIGQNCDIGPNCYIRPSTAIANNCYIGAAVELKNSIIMAGTKIPHLNYVGDSILGEGCNLGAGTKIANLKLTNKNIFINSIDTKKHKLGAIIGDKVKMGINASINVGTMIGNNTIIGPGALAHGIISPDSKIF